MQSRVVGNVLIENTLYCETCSTVYGEGLPHKCEPIGRGPKVGDYGALTMKRPWPSERQEMQRHISNRKGA